MNWIPVDTIKDRLGLPAAPLAAHQRTLTLDDDLKKSGRVWLWSERACVALAASLGVEWPDGLAEKNALPALAGGPQERVWHVFLCPQGNRRIVLAAEKGARPRDVRQTVRIRVPDNRRFGPGTALRCLHLHDDLWDLVSVVKPDRNQVRPMGGESV
jgi:hypothetical protein